MDFGPLTLVDVSLCLGFGQWNIHTLCNDSLSASGRTLALGDPSVAISANVGERPRRGFLGLPTVSLLVPLGILIGGGEPRVDTSTPSLVLGFFRSLRRDPRPFHSFVDRRVSDIQWVQVPWVDRATRTVNGQNVDLQGVGSGGVRTQPVRYGSESPRSCRKLCNTD